MSDKLRKAFTNNAKEFDSLMITMLAENKRLREALKNMDDLTYSFDSRQRMEYIRNVALREPNGRA